MARVFISYRNSDTGPYAGRLADRLAAFQFDAVFEDRESIGIGEDFADSIRAELARCVAVLVLIGKDWVDTRDDAGLRRLDKRNDWVRREVSIALALDLLVVPVLFDSAGPLVAANLPAEIASVASKNAYHFDGRYFDRDADDLARRVEESLMRAARATAGATAPSPKTSVQQQLRVIWIALSGVTSAAAVAPFALPALPSHFWLFPASMTLAAFTWWLYWLAAELPVAPARNRLVSQ